MYKNIGMTMVIIGIVFLIVGFYFDMKNKIYTAFNAYIVRTYNLFMGMAIQSF